MMSITLDDYHNVVGADVDVAVATLVERMPDNLRLVIASRDLPRNDSS